MPQQSLFPIRFGLQVPRGENLQSAEVMCEGGMDQTQTVLETKPGFAVALTNFEVSLTGGYRRINGYTKFSNSVVPGQGKILGVAVYTPGFIIAARQDGTDATVYNIYSGGGSGWTQLNPSTTSQTGTTHNTTTIDGLSSTSGLAVGQPVTGTGIPANTFIASIVNSTSITISNAATNSATETITFKNPLTYNSNMVVTSCYYNWTGTYVIAFTDGYNPSYTWDGTHFVSLVTTGSAADPNFCQEFTGYYFVAGYSSNKGAIKISAPLNANDWAPLDGAAEVVIGDTITGLKSWRNQLFIFCKSSIYRVIGNSTNILSSTPFTIQQVTDRVGCSEGRTIKEINGDLIFLAPDGLRTIQGTIKIGDTEVGSISRPIQSIVNSINPNTTPCHACVVAKKTQYRLFYNNSNSTQASAPGVMAAIRRFRDGHEDWEFAQLQGILLSCCDSNYWISDGNEYVVHGGYDGFVYRQEQGGTFDGTAIQEVYKTVPLEFGDRAIRKVLHRLTIYCSMGVSTSVPTLNLAVIYDLNKTGTIQPMAITVSNLGQANASTYDSGTLWNSGALYDAQGLPFIRQNIQGSGFLAQFQFNSQNATVPYTIQGFEVEYYPAGRR